MRALLFACINHDIKTSSTDYQSNDLPCSLFSEPTCVSVVFKIGTNSLKKFRNYASPSNHTECKEKCGLSLIFGACHILSMQRHKKINKLFICSNYSVKMSLYCSSAETKTCVCTLTVLQCSCRHNVQHIIFCFSVYFLLSEWNKCCGPISQNKNLTKCNF